MMHPRGFGAALVGLLASLLPLVFVLQAEATLAQTSPSGQQGTSQTVGNTTVSFSDAWQPQPASGGAEQLLLFNRDIQNTLYLYTEYEVPATAEAGDTISAFAEGFFSTFGQGAQELVTVGGTTSIVDNVETRLSWLLYSVPVEGTPNGLLLVADTTSQPGRAMVSVLLAPVESFELAVQAVLDGISLNGARSPLGGMDPADLAGDLAEFGLQGAPADPSPTQPAAAETPTGGLTLPPISPPNTTPTPAGPEATQTSTTFEVQPTATEGSGGLALPPLGATEPAGTDATATETPGGLALPPLNPTEPAGAGATETPDGLTLPPIDGTGTAAVAGGGSIDVGGAEVRYSDDWALDEVNSTPGESIFLDVTTGAFQFYGLFVAESSGLAPATSVRVLQDVYFEGVGATGVEELTFAEPAEGIAWALVGAELTGFPMQVLFYVDTVSSPGQERYHLLVSDPGGMADLLAQAQDTIQVSGVPAFAEVDPAVVSAQSGGALPAAGTATAAGPATEATQTPTATPVTTPSPPGSPTTQAGAAIDVSRYEAQDAPNTCDTIGWVSTSSDQAPTTDEDVAFRAACIGGATWLATCGTMAGTAVFGPEPGMQWVRCDIEVRNEGGPMEVSFIDFAIVDANGNRHSFDVLGIASLEDGQSFPDGPVASGETATGSVVFSVPENPATPLVVEIAPLALLGSADATGSLVIADPLQPFGSIGG